VQPSLCFRGGFRPPWADAHSNSRRIVLLHLVFASHLFADGLFETYSQAGLLGECFAQSNWPGHVPSQINTMALSTDYVLRLGPFDHTGKAPADKAEGTVFA
jgi:hypothetical protein